MISASDVFFNMSIKGKAQKASALKSNRIVVAAAFCALGLMLASCMPVEARRAYSSYGDIDEKTLENILNGKSPAKKAARPKPKKRKPAVANTNSTSSGASGSPAGGGSITTSAIETTATSNNAASKMTGKSATARGVSTGGTDDSAGNQAANQAANPNAASFAALAPVPTLQKGSLKGLSKKLSTLVEMSPPTSLDMEREQAQSVSTK